MNYYLSITYHFNHYNALNLTSVAIVSQDNRELFVENVSKAKFRKAVSKFLSVGDTEPKYYTYFTAMQQVAFMSIGYNFSYFRDLNFLEDYISEKVNDDFSVKEDSKYPFPPTSNAPLDNARWMKQLHEFLLQFELNLSINKLRKRIGLDL